MSNAATLQAPFTALVFSVDGQRYGLNLAEVERALRLIRITPLPHAPEIVIGVINVGGAVIPAIDLRLRFRVPSREALLTDRFILVRTPRRRVALLADEVSGVEQIEPGHWIESADVLPRTNYVAGIAKRDDGLILINDLDEFLSLEEERSLNAAMEQSTPIV